MRNGSLASDSWKTRAVPWKLPWIDAGTPMRFIVSLIAATASLSERPGARLKDKVAATNMPW